MATFNREVRKLISEYRRLLRKWLGYSERHHKLTALNITSHQLKSATDIQLYHCVHHIINDLITTLDQQPSTGNEYSGLEEFSNHTQRFINCFIVSGNQVIHVHQHTSSTLLDVIQHLATPQDNLCPVFEQKVRALNRQGSIEQKKLLATALLKNRHTNKKIIRKLLHTLVAA